MPKAEKVDSVRQSFAGADVAAAGSRTVAAAWNGASARKGHARVRVLVGAARDGGAATLRRVGVVGRDYAGEYMKLAVTGAGAALVAWEDVGSGTSRLGVAIRPAGGPFGAPTWMGAATVGEQDTPELALLRGNRGYVAYEAFKSGDDGGDSYRRVYVSGWRR
jgi:hypothetical protein